MLSNEYIAPKVKSLLNIDDTDIYDSRLEIIIGAAESKLELEGIENVFDEGSNIGLEYIMCLSYQVAFDLGLIDESNKNINQQYITRVNQIRCWLRAKQTSFM